MKYLFIEIIRVFRADSGCAVRGYEKVDEEKRFKHKLNMLEPGTRMLKWIGILILIGIMLYVFHFRMAAFVYGQYRVLFFLFYLLYWP